MVYKIDSTETTSEQPQVLKVISLVPPKKTTVSQEEYNERLISELSIGRKVSHPNLVAINGISTDGAHVFVRMPHVQGSSLLQYLGKNRQGLPTDEIKKIGYQLSLALRYLHSEGIVHRDLKLENVIYDGETAILIDFGAAHMTKEEKLLSKPIGSESYWPLDFTQTDYNLKKHFYDVYALCLLMFEIAMGKPMPDESGYRCSIAEAISQNR